MPDCPPVHQAASLSDRPAVSWLLNCRTVWLPAYQAVGRSKSLAERRTDCMSDCSALLSVRLSSSFVCQTVQLSPLPNPSVRLYCPAPAVPSVRLPAVPSVWLLCCPLCQTARLSHCPAWSLVWLWGCLVSFVSSSNSVTIILWSDSVNSLGHS